MVKKKKEIRLIIFLLLFSLLTSGWALYLMGQEHKLIIGEKEELDFHFRLAENDVVGWNKGELVWRIQASNILEPPVEEGSYKESSEELILRDIYRGYFYRQKEELFTFTVEEAHYDARTGDLVLFTCRLESPLGDWFETDELYYDKKKDQLHGPGKVIGNMGGTDIEAEEMKIYFEREEINLFKVKMIHNWKKDK